MRTNFVNNKLILKSNNNLDYKQIFNNGKSFHDFIIKKINGKENIKNKNKSFNNIGKMFYQNDEKNNETKIFGQKFVKTNNKKAKIIINNKQYNLREKIKNIKDNIIFKIKIKFLENMVNLDSMFKECDMLLKVEKFSNFKTNYLKNLNYLFYIN